MKPTLFFDNGGECSAKESLPDEHPETEIHTQRLQCLHMKAIQRWSSWGSVQGDQLFSMNAEISVA